MKVTRCIFLIGVIFCLLSSCASEEASLPDCFEGGFECEISFEWEGLSYRVEILREAGYGSDLTLSFLEPEAMKGITVSRRDGSESVRLFESEYTEVGRLGWLALEDLFLVSGSVVDSRLEECCGVSANRLTFRREDGVDGVIYLSGEEEPLRICGAVGGRYADATILKFRRK